MCRELCAKVDSYRHKPKVRQLQRLWVTKRLLYNSSFVHSYEGVGVVTGLGVYIHVLYVHGLVLCMCAQSQYVSVYYKPCMLLNSLSICNPTY